MSEPSAIKRLWSRPDILGIEWSDGTSSEFASLWLRDNLPEDRDPHSGQRLIDIADLPDNPRIRSAVARNGAVSIEWESEPRPAAFRIQRQARTPNAVASRARRAAARRSPVHSVDRADARTRG